MMQELKRSYEDTLDAHYLCIEVNSEEVLDHIATNVLKQDQPGFIMPLSIREKNDKLFLRYKLPENAIALKYINTSLKKQDFLKMYKGLLEPLMDAGDWFLDPHSFLVDPENVYVDRKSGKCLYAYVPCTDYRHTDDEIYSFLKSGFTEISLEDDNDLLLKLFKFFDSGSRHTLGELDSLLENELGSAKGIGQDHGRSVDYARKNEPTSKPESINTPIVEETRIPEAKPVVSEKPFVPEKSAKPVVSATDSKKKPEQDVEEKKDDLFAELFGSTDTKDKSKKKKEKEKKEKTPKEKENKSEKNPGKLGGLFGGRKKQENEQPKEPQIPTGSTPAPAQEIQRQEYRIPSVPERPRFEEDTVTVILEDGMDEVESGDYLELVSSTLEGAPKRINLEFTTDRLLIGRMVPGESIPDIHFPKEFKSIGRRHALIEKRPEGLYLVDLGSINHTTLNGEIIAPNRPYPITDGSIIGFTTGKPVKYKLVLG